MLKFEFCRSEKGDWTIAHEKAIVFLGCSAHMTLTSLELETSRTVGRMFLLSEGGATEGAVFCGFKLLQEKYATRVRHDT